MVKSEQPRSASGNKKGAVTITDVAALAGVSRATVGYTLTTPGRVSDEIRGQVQKAIEELGYKGNEAARQLRMGRSRAIALIVSNAANPVFATVAAGAERESARQGGFILLANSAEDVQREREYIAFFESQGVSGILIAPVLEVPPELPDLESRGTPFVLIGTQLEPHNYPSISGDDEQGGYLATKHLIEQGRRRLAFIGGPYRQIQNRYGGARRAAKEAKGVSLEWIDLPMQTVRAAEEAVNAMFSSPEGLPYDGIFAGNDLVAIGLLHRFVEGKVRIPEDLSLVGYDDIEFAATAIIPLTTIRHDSADMGAGAVRLLSEAIAGSLDASSPQSQQLYPPELVVRGTSRATQSSVK